MTTSPTEDGPRPGIIHTASRINSKDLTGMVELHWGEDLACEFTPDQARAFALTVIATAEAAENDAALVHELLAMDLDLQDAAVMIKSIRLRRAGLT